MALSDLHAYVTVILLVVFLGIVWWVYGKRRKSDFDEAARMPLEDEEETRPRDQREDR